MLRINKMYLQNKSQTTDAYVRIVTSTKWQVTILV